MPIWGQLLIVFGGIILAVVLVPYILKGVLKGILKLRLLPLLLYCIAAATSMIFTDWVKTNFNLVLIGFFAILGFIMISWIITFFKYRSEKRMIINQLRIADPLGISTNGIIVKDGILYDSKTDEPLIQVADGDEDEES